VLGRKGLDEILRSAEEGESRLLRSIGVIRSLHARTFRATAATTARGGAHAPHRSAVFAAVSAEIDPGAAETGVVSTLVLLCHRDVAFAAIAARVRTVDALDAWGS
jgi:hypothetical protein